MNVFLISLCLFLVSCASVQIPKEVIVPVSVPCISADVVSPDFLSHAHLKSLSAPDYVLEITAEYLKYESYTGELSAVISGCK